MPLYSTHFFIIPFFLSWHFYLSLLSFLFWPDAELKFVSAAPGKGKQDRVLEISSSRSWDPPEL